MIRGLLCAGALLDLIGTGVAAWFLHAWVLLAVMVFGLIAWVAWLTLRGTAPAGVQREAYS